MNSVTQRRPSGAIRSQYYTYDSRRRVCRYHTDEAGSTGYEYDDSGYLTAYEKGLSYGASCPSLLTNSLSRIDLSYDGVGRLKTTDFVHWNTHDIVRHYDANNNLTHVSRGGGADIVHWSYAFNELNQITHEYLDMQWDQNNQVYQVNYDSYYSYSPDGFVTSRKLPNNQWTTHTRDGLGRDRTVTYDPGGANVDLITNVTYHASGAVAAMDYGNGHEYASTLDSMLRPTNASTETTSITAFDRDYTYTPRGQIEDITDNVDSSYSQSFIYDGLGQLTTATGKWGSASYSYDAIGNIQSKVFSNWLGNGARSVNMSYDSSNRLSSYTDTGPLGNKSLSYDVRGNVTALGGLNMTYDLSDQPVTMSGTADATYYYDGNLKRVKSETGTGANAKTIYNVYDQSGSLVFVDKHTDAEEVTTIRGAGMTLARIIDDGITEEITYIHTDHLGSTSVATDTAGAVLWSEHHSPFGEVMNPQTANDDLAAFTGHIRDSATGLTYMQARYYDPVGARFLSIDPVRFVGSGGHPGMFNRYSYTFNDPVNMVDPDGEYAETIWDAGNVILGATSTVSNFKEGNYGAATIDGIGTIVDLAATLVPFVPAGASASIKGARVGLNAADSVGDAKKALNTYPDGSFRLTDMSGYPSSVSARPDQALRLISGDEYKAARRAANNANTKLRKEWGLSSNQQIHEVVPVKFGGDPTDVGNKIVVTTEQHKKLNKFWRKLQNEMEDK